MINLAVKTTKLLGGVAAATLLVLVSQPVWAEGDAAAGEKVYKKCKACHSLEEGKNKVGPSLYGVYGRAAGAVEGYKYSSALKDSGLTWDDATLDKYLEKPKDLIPKTKMAFPGLKEEADRQNVIAYIKDASQ
jgi:cytochrome c